MHAIVRYKCAPSHTRPSRGRRLFASCAVPERQARGADMRVERPRAGCRRPWASRRAVTQAGRNAGCGTERRGAGCVTVSTLQQEKKKKKKKRARRSGPCALRSP
jgi:hypothetical protein